MLKLNFFGGFLLLCNASRLRARCGNPVSYGFQAERWLKDSLPRKPRTTRPTGGTRKPEPSAPDTPLEPLRKTAPDLRKSPLEPHAPWHLPEPNLASAPSGSLPETPRLSVGEYTKHECREFRAPEAHSLPNRLGVQGSRAGVASAPRTFHAFQPNWRVVFFLKGTLLSLVF